jgi:hypothetical protein
MLEVNLLLLTFLIKKQLTITLLRTTYVYTDSHNTHWISKGKVVYSRIIKNKINMENNIELIHDEIMKEMQLTPEEIIIYKQNNNLK